MDKTRHIVDKYFDKARKERPVMSKAEANMLLNRKILSGTTPSGTFFFRRSALLSSPLRLAAAASLAVVAGAGAWLAFSIPDSPILAELPTNAPIVQPVDPVNATAPDTEWLDVQEPAEVNSDNTPPVVAQLKTPSNTTPRTALPELNKNIPVVVNNAAHVEVEETIPARKVEDISHAEGMSEALALNTSRTTAAANPLKGVAIVDQLVEDFAEVENKLRINGGYQFGVFAQSLDYLNAPIDEIGLDRLPASTQRFAYHVGVAYDDFALNFMYADADDIQVNGTPNDVFTTFTQDYTQYSINAMYRVIKQNNFTVEAGIGVALADETMQLNDVRIAGQLAPVTDEWNTLLALYSILGNRETISVQRQIMSVGPRLAVSYKAFKFMTTAVTFDYYVQQPTKFKIDLFDNGSQLDIPDSEQYTNDVFAVSVDMQIEFGQFF